MKIATFLFLVVAADALKVQDTKWGFFGKPTKQAKQNKEAPAIVDFEKVSQEHGKAVFYAVIMGAKYTQRHQVSLWLSSLREKQMGNWDGEAIIVTDKPKCLAKTLEETKMLGKKDLDRSNEFVDVYGPPEGLTGNLHVIKRPHTGAINRMKLEKARAWINFRNSGIQGKVGLIVYTDEDIVMGKDVHNFVAEATSYVPDKHSLALFRDTGASKGELHTGVVVIYNNEHAQACVKEWGRKLTGLDIDEWRNEHDVKAVDEKAGEGLDATDAAKEQPKLVDESAFEKEAIETDESEAESDEGLQQEGVMGPDQQALGRTQPCRADENHKGIKIMPKDYFWFPDGPGMANNQIAEFIHFTNTGRWSKIGPSRIAAYLKNIGVPDHVDPTGHSHSEECIGEEKAAQYVSPAAAADKDLLTK